MSSGEMDVQWRAGDGSGGKRAVEAWRRMPVGGVGRHAGQAS